MKQIAVLISGGGTNLQNLAEECKKNLKGKCKIAIVISNIEGVKGIEIAESYDIKVAVLPDLMPKISIIGGNITDYNVFATHKAKADEAFTKINQRLILCGKQYSLIQLLEDCLKQIFVISQFPEEDIKEAVLMDIFYEAFTRNKEIISEEEEHEILSQIDTILYELIEEIKIIAELFECIRRQPAFLKFFAREKYDEILDNFLKQEKIDYIFLAGFMRILSPSFTRKWAGKIYNIHPSLLPAFGGAKAVKEALQFGVKITGCTVHIVDAGVDSGKIIAQKAVEVLERDTEATLHERIKQAEKELYPTVLRNLIEGDL